MQSDGEAWCTDATRTRKELQTPEFWYRSVVNNGCIRTVLALTAASAMAAPAAIAQEPSLELSASTPIVTLAPRAQGRFINLPELEFAFELQPDCPAEWQPESILLSIADTRASLRGGDINRDTLSPVVLKVPASQIAPVAAESFCRVDEANESIFETSELRLPETVTVHASLRCSADEKELIAYVSRSLDVTVRCEVTADEERVAGE